MNKEITIIDLLNKIANGEEVPKKIRYDGNDYYFCNPCRTYEIIESSELCGKDLYDLLDNLNDKVEIIEEDNKIGKLDIRTDINTGNNFILNEHGKRCYLTTHSKIIAEKVNELIDEIEKLKENHEN